VGQGMEAVMSDKKISCVWGAVLFGVLTLLSAQSASAAADVTQARYMRPSQFLHSIKQVSLTLGVDVLAADSEEKLANVSLGEVLDRAQKNRRSACALSGFANNMGMSPGAC